MSNPWLSQHDDVIRAYHRYAYDHEMALIVGHPAQIVGRKRRALGLAAYRGTPVSYSILEALPGPSLLQMRADAA